MTDIFGDTQGTINIADAIQRQATAQKKKAIAQTQPAMIDPFADLMAQLQQQLNGVRAQSYMTPLEQLRAQAQSSVAAQYDPQIKALQSEMGRTTQRGNRNIADAKAMYNALSSDISGQLGGIKADFAQANKDTANRYAGAQADLQKSYDASAAEQQAIMKQLGVQAAMPEASKEQAADEAYFSQLQKADQRQTQDALAQLAQGAEQFNTQSSNNARLAGNNAAQDIGAQLEDYLQQAGGQLSALTSGKESAIAAAIAQLQAADQQRADSMAQQAQNQIMQLANFQLQARKAFNDMQQEGTEDPLFKGTSGLAGATNYLAQQYPDSPTRASALTSLLGQLMSDQGMQQGRQTIKNPTTGMKEQVPITDQYVLQKIRELAQAQNFEQFDINNVMDAYLASQGRLR